MLIEASSKTIGYQYLRSLILGEKFPHPEVIIPELQWQLSKSMGLSPIEECADRCGISNEDCRDGQFFSHTIIDRPEFSRPLTLNQNMSVLLHPFMRFMHSTLQQNGIKLKEILRANVNTTFPDGANYPSYPHYDHNFEHKMFIWYLHDSDGDTVCEKERITPKKDQILITDRVAHYSYPPTKGLRTILVSTFQ
jgi:hypothetical protein